MDTDIKARYIGFRHPDGSVTMVWKWQGSLHEMTYDPSVFVREKSVTWVELADIAEPGDGCDDAAGSEVAQVRKEV